MTSVSISRICLASKTWVSWAGAAIIRLMKEHRASAFFELNRMRCDTPSLRPENLVLLPPIPFLCIKTNTCGTNQLDRVDQFIQVANTYFLCHNRAYASVRRDHSGGAAITWSRPWSVIENVTGSACVLPILTRAVTLSFARAWPV